MKPASIVTLILSAILIFFGIIMCLIGVGMAKASDQDLFTQVSDNETYYKQEFSANEITKIEFLVKDAEINIFGNSDSSYIEYVNYNPNLYSITTTSRIISFDEIPDLTSMLKFWENGFGFKGLRHVFDYKNYFLSGLNKKINLYVSSNSSLSSINIEADNADINIKETYISGSCSLDITKGNINFDNFSAYSDITVETNTSDINMTNVSTQKFSLISSDSNIISDMSKFNNVDISLSNGNIDIKNRTPQASTSYILSSNIGAIFFDGENKGNTFMNAVSEIKSEIKIKTETANINYQPIQ